MKFALESLVFKTPVFFFPNETLSFINLKPVGFVRLGMFLSAQLTVSRLAVRFLLFDVFTLPQEFACWCVDYSTCSSSCFLSLRIKWASRCISLISRWIFLLELRVWLNSWGVCARRMNNSRSSALTEERQQTREATSLRSDRRRTSRTVRKSIHLQSSGGNQTVLNNRSLTLKQRFVDDGTVKLSNGWRLYKRTQEFLQERQPF